MKGIEPQRSQRNAGIEIKAEQEKAEAVSFPDTFNVNERQRIDKKELRFKKEDFERTQRGGKEGVCCVVIQELLGDLCGKNDDNTRNKAGGGIWNCSRGFIHEGACGTILISR